MHVGYLFSDIFTNVKLNCFASPLLSHTIPPQFRNLELLDELFYFLYESPCVVLLKVVVTTIS